MKFNTILIDPPWRYGKKGVGRTWGKGSQNCVCAKSKCNIDTPMSYRPMEIDEIRAIPIPAFANSNCEVYLWTTEKYLPLSFSLFGSWGVKYCTTLVWCKTPMGTGQGGVYTPTTEFLIHGRYGNTPNVRRLDSTWLYTKRQRRHSQKPEEFQDMIEKVTHPPRLEMFARRKREGWYCWGDEIDSDIEIAGLA